MASGYDLRDEKQAQQYLRDVETEYQFQCLHEKAADGCHRLAEFRHTIKNDIPAATALYKENCNTNNYPRSCYKYGERLLTDTSVPKKARDYLTILKYMEKSCDFDSADGCYVAAQMRASENVGEMKSLEKSNSMYRKACGMKHGEACFELSSMYLMGHHVEKNLKQSFEFAKLGCDLENIKCCNNLNVMYRHGHGTEKNIKLADEMKKRAVSLSVEAAKKQQELRVNE